jgi:DNA polymerase-3 subunit delta'
MTLFSSLVGQSRAVSVIEGALEAARVGAATQEMTHAWLFTGPPGSGRSNLARAFAAALVCKSSGCGSCRDCQTALAGTHPDVEILRVDGVSIKIDEIRDLLSRSAWGASVSPWRVVVIEDSDRMTEAAASALLKSIEEPGAQTVWILSAPTLADVLPTVRSRCRHLALTTPSQKSVIHYLVSKLNITEREAELAARISQGHIGRAQYFAQSSESREVRNKIFNILFSVKSESTAVRAAQNLIDLATERAKLRVGDAHEKEESELRAALQGTNRGMVTGGAKVIKDLEKEQKSRVTRLVKDELDGYLLDYLTFLRDALALAMGAREMIINIDYLTELERLSSLARPAQISQLSQSLMRSREHLASNAAQLLVLEALTFEFLALNR